MAVDRERSQTFFECRSRVVAGSYEQLIEPAFPVGVLCCLLLGKESLATTVVAVQTDVGWSVLLGGNPW